MEIVFLASAKADLRWFKQYYMRVFPDGKKNADQQFHAFLNLLRTNPLIGEAVHGFVVAREFPIHRTPFTVIYRVGRKQIEILRVFDQRSEFSNTFGAKT